MKIGGIKVKYEVLIERKNLSHKEIAFIGKEKVTWKSIMMGRVDIKRFKMDYPGLYGKYIKKSFSRRFSIVQ